MSTQNERPYRLLGHGDHHVIVLHGWFGSAEAWGPLLPHLDGESFGYAFSDYRGYGARKAEAGVHSLAEAADDVLELATRLGWDTFSVIGHSMGGTVMQQVLLKAPQRVRALVGISPVPACGVPFDDATWQFFSGAVQDPNLRRAIIDRSTGGHLTSTWLDAMTKRSVDDSDVQAFADYLHSWSKTDFHDEVVGNQVPAKVIIGANDPDLNTDFMTQTFGSWYPNFELRVLQSAGHYAMDEVPVALATEIESFLKEH